MKPRKVRRPKLDKMPNLEAPLKARNRLYGLGIPWGRGLGSPTLPGDDIYEDRLEATTPERFVAAAFSIDRIDRHMGGGKPKLDPIHNDDKRVDTNNRKHFSAAMWDENAGLKIVSELHAYIRELGKRNAAPALITSANRLGEYTKNAATTHRLAVAQYTLGERPYSRADDKLATQIAKEKDRQLQSFQQELSKKGRLMMPAGWTGIGGPGHAVVSELLSGEGKHDRARFYDAGTAPAPPIDGVARHVTGLPTEVLFDTGALAAMTGARLLSQQMDRQVYGVPMAEPSFTKDYVQSQEHPILAAATLGKGLRRPDRLTKKQTVGNCGHKTLMHYLKDHLSRDDYLGFKNHMRTNRLVELRKNSGASSPLYRAAADKHRRWQRKHKFELMPHDALERLSNRKDGGWTGSSMFARKEFGRIA